MNYNEKVFGIRCNVSNCTHNRYSSECSAGKIDVCRQCTNPHDSEQTKCKTFRQRG